MRWPLVSLLVVALLAPGCSGGSLEARSHLPVVRVTERDFRISAPTRVAAGDVLLSAHNAGPDEHELVVIRAETPNLPLRSDGITVDEEGVGPSLVGVIEPYAPNSIETLQIHLSPGRYEFICNMSGHYLGGMHTSVVVG
jgi:uncharacterized cupredoxin-like copper-binding protein